MAAGKKWLFVQQMVTNDGDEFQFLELSLPCLAFIELKNEATINSKSLPTLWKTVHVLLKSLTSQTRQGGGSGKPEVALAG